MSNEESIKCLILYNVIPKEPSPDDAPMDLNEERTEVAAIRNALKECGYSVRTLGIRYMSPKVIHQIADTDADFIFNLVEQLYDQGRMEMYVAGLFHLLKIPYTGSPPLVLGIAQNKAKTKQILKSAGIPVAPGFVALPGEKISLASLNLPVIVKPVREDGSAGITANSIAHTSEEILQKVAMVHEEYKQPALVEEFIEGREFHVYILGNNPPRVLAISEIDFSGMPKNEPHMLSYDAKWVTTSAAFKGTEEVIGPAVDAALKSRLEKIALKTYKEIGCRDYSRVDMRVNSDDRAFVLEVNTNPDVAPESGLEKVARSVGMTYAQLIGEIAGYALERPPRTQEVAALSAKTVL